MTTWKSLRNVRGVHLIASGQLNTYDVLVSDHVVFTESALAQFVGEDRRRACRRRACGREPGRRRAADAETEPAETEETEATEPEDDES